MAVDRSLEDFFAAASQARNEERTTSRALHGSGGGGTSGGMEARLARLEADMEHVKHDMGALKADVRSLVSSVAVIDEKLKHVATVSQMWLAATGIVAAIGGIVALIVRFLPHSA